MLITCFQCRQQLDVPEDSAGKRVRCLHCQYVIVVPDKRKAPAESAESALTALPSMELDADGEKEKTTKLAPLPLPPITPPIPVVVPEGSQGLPPIEDLPPPPPVDRQKRKRVPMTPLPSSGWRGARYVGYAVLIIVVVGVVVTAVAMSGRPRHHVPPPNQFVFQQQQQQPMQKQPPNFGEERMARGMGAEFPPWQHYQDPAGRYKVEFPGAPGRQNQNINFTPMTAAVAKPFDWEFSVAYRTMALAQFKAVSLAERSRQVQQHFRNTFNALAQQEHPVVLAPGDHPGTEWHFSLPQGGWLFVRTFFVRDGANYHHFVLTAKGPPQIFRFDANINRFFNSFQVLASPIRKGGQPVYEQLDDLNAGGRRDNEFTALALHPTRPIVVVGSRCGALASMEAKGSTTVAPRDQRPVSQVSVSEDGAWLAVAIDSEVQVWKWRDQDDPAVLNPFVITHVVPGRRCAFLKKNRLLTATKTELTEYDCAVDPFREVARMPSADLTIEGFAVSADCRTLALHGDKSIAICAWPEKKELGRFEAHDAPVMAVAFSPDGKTLASASADRSIKLWDVETRTLRATLKQHAWTVAAVAFTPDGKHLVSGGIDGMLLVWALDLQPRLIWAQPHQFPIRAVGFDADGKHCYFTCRHPVVNPQQPGRQWQRQLRKLVWSDIKPNLQESQRIVAEQAGLHLPVGGLVHWSPDGRTIVTTDGVDKFGENNLRVWDAMTATAKYARPMQRTGVLSPDGKWFVYAKPAGQHQLQLLEVQTQRVADSVLAQDFTPDLAAVMFTPDSKSLWVQRNNQFVRYEIQLQKKGNPVLVQKNQVTLKKPNDAGFYFVHPALDLQTFVVERVTPDGVMRTLTLHAAADGAILPLPKSAPGVWSSHLRLRLAGNRFEMEDVLHGLSQTIGQQGAPRFAMALDWERKHAASTQCLNNQTVRVNLWDVQERRPLLTLPNPQARTATALRFSPDGRQLALVTGEGWTRIVPTDWLLERKGLLPCNPNEVGGR